MEAYLCETSGRTSICNDTNPRSFLKDGSSGGLYISDIREEAGQIGTLVHSEEQGSSSPGEIINIDLSDKIPGMYLVEVKNSRFRENG